MQTERRYDVDWMRVIAIGLLIFYHALIAFQWFGSFLAFPTSRQTLPGAWRYVQALNIWRIPILFVISGMGARFALERRTVRQYVADRSFRIGVPWLFGTFTLNFVIVYVGTVWYRGEFYPIPNQAHLWFLGNILLYVFVTLPLFAPLVKRQKARTVVTPGDSPIWSSVLLLVGFVAAVGIEGFVMQPEDFASYAVTLHGLVLGLVCFVMGFMLVHQHAAWELLKRLWPATLAIAIAMYVIRVWVEPTWFGLVSFRNNREFGAINGLESAFWMLSMIGLASAFLRKGGPLLRYLSPAVYPIYIFHLPVQFLLSFLVLRSSLSGIVQLIILTVGTVAISLGVYELVRRTGPVRTLFGMTWKRPAVAKTAGD